MKSSILALVFLAGILGTSQSTKADERSGDHHSFGHHDEYDSDYHHGYDRDYYRDYSWDDPYWYHNHYGYWHHHRGYWTYRGHDHIFINVD